MLPLPVQGTKATEEFLWRESIEILGSLPSNPGVSYLSRFMNPLPKAHLEHIGARGKVSWHFYLLSYRGVVTKCYYATVDNLFVTTIATLNMWEWFYILYNSREKNHGSRLELKFSHKIKISINQNQIIELNFYFASCSLENKRDLLLTKMKIKIQFPIWSWYNLVQSHISLLLTVSIMYNEWVFILQTVALWHRNILKPQRKVQLHPECSS